MDTALLQRSLDLLGNRYPVRLGGLYLDTVTISDHKIRIDYTEYLVGPEPLPVANTWDSFLTTVPRRHTEWYDLNSTVDCQKLERMLEDAERTRSTVLTS